jgi:hypothetical protein
MLPEGNNQSEQSDEVEALRLILEQEQHRPVNYDEAQEVADSLISFFEVLADGEVIDEPVATPTVVQAALEFA